MSGYYYSREPGAEGQILTGEGTAPGVGLDVLAERERPPLRAALAIGSAMADLLCIASEDQLVHGDIRPAHVKIDERGQVSIEGFGVQRRTTRAPEGKPDGTPVDIYGLGVVLHSILSADPLGNLAKDPDGHDDEVVSRVLAMDFREVQGKRWLEDVRKFLCQILAWAPADRPAALDAANVLASVAAQCPGESLESWAGRASAAPAARPAPAPAARKSEEEDLGGPVALSSPITTGGVRVAPAAKGESTAFWSREKIAAMLAEDDDDDAPPAAAPRRETVNIPPKRTEPPAAPPPRAEPKPEPVRSEPPRSQPPKAEPKPEPKAEPRPEPRRTAEPAASPFANARIEASTPIEEPPPKKTSPIVWVVVALVVLAVICGGLTLGGGGLYYFVGGSSTADVEKAQEEAARQAEEAKAKAEKAAEEAKAQAEDATAKAADATAEAGEAKAETKTEEPAKAEPATTEPAKAETKTEAPKTTPPTTSSPTTTTTKTTTTKTTTTPKTTTTTKTTAPTTTKTTSSTPAPATGSFSVKFSIPGREGKLQCGDGQTADFAGATTMSFEGTTTCLVRIGSGKGAVQVSKSATVTCSEDAGKVTCGGN